MEVREEFFPAFFFFSFSIGAGYCSLVLRKEVAKPPFFFSSNEAFVVRFTEAGNRHSLAFLCAALKHSPQGCFVVVPLPGKVLL